MDKNPDYFFTCNWCAKTYYYGPPDGYHHFCSSDCHHKEHQHALAEIKAKYGKKKPESTSAQKASSP